MHSFWNFFKIKFDIILVILDALPYFRVSNSFHCQNNKVHPFFFSLLDDFFRVLVYYYICFLSSVNLALLVSYCLCQLLPTIAENDFVFYIRGQGFLQKAVPIRYDFFFIFSSSSVHDSLILSTLFYFL